MANKANKAKIKNDIKMLHFSEDILNDYLDSEGKFIPSAGPSGEKNYFLISKDDNWETRKSAHGKEVNVVRLMNGFFMYCSIGFKVRKANTVDFKSISLQFYDESLLFRAEWVNWDIEKEESNLEEDIKPHPQPHWHLGDMVHKSVSVERKADGFIELVEQSGFQEFETKKIVKQDKHYSDLHFSMRMEEGETFPFIYDLTFEEDYKFWLRETMKHVDKELSYLV